MGNAFWLALLIIAAGTYAMRAIPLILMRRHLKKHADREAVDVVPPWLGTLAPLMIAAMLGVTLVPATPDLNSWISTAVGAVVTLLVWARTRSLGLPVLIGVAAFGLLAVVLP